MRRLASESSLPLRSFSAFAAVFVLFLVVAGGLVTSTGSGLSVPDWPLSFGQWMPPMAGGVFYEHGHRLIATAAGFLTVVLALWISLSQTSRAVARFAWAAVALVIAQGIFGGVTVLLKLPALTSVVHACLGQIYFASMACLAVLLWDPAPSAAAATGQGSGVPRPGTVRAERLAWITLGFIFLQLLLGAIYRHSGYLLHAHMLGAAVVAIHAVLLWKRLRRFPAPRPPAPAALAPVNLARGLLILVGVQTALGLFAWLKPYPSVTTAHVAVGALLLGGAAACGLQLRRRIS